MTQAYSVQALKRSGIHFLLGKGFSALINFGILLGLVRWLSVADYSVYVTLVAGFSVSTTFTNLGLPWLAARYLPEFRLHASKRLMLWFIGQLTLLFALTLALTALLAYMNLEWLLVHLDMQAYKSAVQYYLWIAVIEGLGVCLRDHILGALLLQGLAQLSMVLRNFALLVQLLILVYITATKPISLEQMIIAELDASLFGTLIAFMGIIIYSYRSSDLTPKVDWKVPRWLDMWKTARHMYFSETLGQAYGPEMFAVLIRQMLGAEATAIYGFSLNLCRQIKRYLPAVLLFGLIRPRLIAAYLGEGGITDLAKNANLAGKLSMFVLMPLVVCVCSTSEILIDKLSGGQLDQTGFYFAGLLLHLIPSSQRQILETVAVATGNSRLCQQAAFLGVFILLLAYVLYRLDFGLWAPIIAIFCGQVQFNATLVWGLRKKAGYLADVNGFYTLQFNAVLAYIASSLLLVSGSSWSWLIASCALIVLLFLLAAYTAKPFTTAERSSINSVLKRNVFIW